MADLSVDFAGLKLKNPFIIASSELTNKVEKIKIAEEHGASAVSTKLTFLKVPLYARPYHIIEKGGRLLLALRRAHEGRGHPGAHRSSARSRPTSRSSPT